MYRLPLVQILRVWYIFLGFVLLYALEKYPKYLWCVFVVLVLCVVVSVFFFVVLCHGGIDCLLCKSFLHRKKQSKLLIWVGSVFIIDTGAIFVLTAFVCVLKRSQLQYGCLIVRIVSLFTFVQIKNYPALNPCLFYYCFITYILNSNINSKSI